MGVLSSYRMDICIKPAYCLYLTCGYILNGKASEISDLGVETFYSMKAATV